MKTINEISRLIGNDFDSAIVIGGYLDEFKSSDINEKIASIQDPPIKDIGIKGAYLAAMTEHLCFKNNIEIPKWVNDNDFFLKYPYFYTSFENLKAILIQESPAAFRRRNIFVSKNALSRV